MVAYAQMLLPEKDAPAVAAMMQLSAAAASLYDAVFYATDMFDPRQPQDALRSKVADQQLLVDQALRETAAKAGISLIEIPRGMTTSERVGWISRYLSSTRPMPY